MAVRSRPRVRHRLRTSALAALGVLATAGLSSAAACATEPSAARPPGPAATVAVPLQEPSGGRRSEGSLAAAGPGPAPAVVLDGERVEVRWIDGDSLRIRTGVHRGRSARVRGYNSLESYGPVHRWGDWTAEELLAIARSATAAAAAGEWRCTTQGARDRYQRLLVDCPDAAAALVRRGLAMAYAVGGPADARTLAAQEEARRAGAGMWAKGAPRLVVTSLHSLDEAEGGATEVYDRVVEVATGRAREVRHATRYRTCEERCRGEGPDRTCMTYVPFADRYRGRPACLRDSPRRGRAGRRRGRGVVYAALSAPGRAGVKFRAVVPYRGPVAQLDRAAVS